MKSITASITFDQFLKGEPFYIIENSENQFYKLEETSCDKSLIICKLRYKKTEGETTYHCNVDSITKQKTVKTLTCATFDRLHKTTLKLKKA